MTVLIRPIVLIAFAVGAFIAAIALTSLRPRESESLLQEHRNGKTPSTLVEIPREPSQRAPIDSAIDPHTTTKYRYLLESFDPTAPNTTKLLALLQAREDLARAEVDHQQSNSKLHELDTEILSMLDAPRHALFTGLRDSDPEQRALGDLAAGMAQNAPLDESQRRELLLSKLRHKQQYEAWLEQSGLDRASLSIEERNYAHELVERALNDYRDAYLQEMQAHLDEEQFRLLSDFERTEFALELQRVQQRINER